MNARLITSKTLSNAKPFIMTNKIIYLAPEHNTINTRDVTLGRFNLLP